MSENFVLNAAPFCLNQNILFRPNGRNFVWVLCCWILQYYQTRIDLKSTLSFWDLNQFDDPRFRHCGMWYTHVDTRVPGQPGHVRDDTFGQLSETRGVSMIHGVQSVLVWSIWVNHSCSHVSWYTCLICQPASGIRVWSHGNI